MRPTDPYFTDFSSSTNKKKAPIWPKKAPIWQKNAPIWPKNAPIWTKNAPIWTKNYAGNRLYGRFSTPIFGSFEQYLVIPHAAQ